MEVEDKVDPELQAIEAKLTDGEALLEAGHAQNALALFTPLLETLFDLKHAEDASDEQEYDPALGRPRRQQEHTVRHDAEKQQLKRFSTIDLRERCIFGMVAANQKLQRAADLVVLLNKSRPLFATMPKAKTAKIVRVVIDALGMIPGSEELQIQLCNDYIAWSTLEKRTFLRQRIQARLVQLQLSRGENGPALTILKELQSEVKRMDDKPLLVEIFLLESQAWFALRNAPKAKGALTAARSSSNAIYVIPALQAQLDMQGGILNANDKDYRTAYSYFYEAFSNLSDLQDNANASKALKYMVLCKIMQNKGDDLPAIFNSKQAMKHLGPDMEAMKEVAKAYKERSLHLFDIVLDKYAVELKGDALVSKHLSDLQASLLEGNLLRLIEPFSRIEITRVAELINLPLARVEAKLAEMILDKKLHGILDHGQGVLVVFDDAKTDPTYDLALDVISSFGEVVDSLATRATNLA